MGLDSIRARVPLPGAWLVGGSVRDLLLGRPVTDVDLVVERDAGDAAPEASRLTGGTPFPLSERHGAWRVVGDGLTVDLAACRGTLTDDMALRDFTVNAMAMPLEGGELLDPHGGRGDLERRLLLGISQNVFDADPLRLLRLARIAHELGFEIDEATLALARSRAHLAGRPAGERIFHEIRRLLAAPEPADGMRLLDTVGALDVVLPEIAATKGLEQSPYHQLDVFHHTLHVLDTVADVTAHPGHYLPAQADLVAERMDGVVGDELPAWQALRLAALFHDIAKPQTRTEWDDRIGFPGHDRRGAAIAAEVLGRWKTSGQLARFCSIMVTHHLALGFAVRERPLSRRAAYLYRRATAPWWVESVVLSLADRLCTRGAWSKARHLRAHTETAEELLGLVAALEQASPPRFCVATRSPRPQAPAAPTSARSWMRWPKSRRPASSRAARRRWPLCARSRFDRTAERYAAEARQRDWSTLIELCAPRAGEAALDVAAGPGTLSAALLPLVARAVALDSSAALLQHAPGGVERVVADAARLPFDAAAFSIVTCVNGLHHLSDPEIALAEMARVLGPDGRLVVQDYLADRDPVAAARWDEIERLRAADHQRLPRRGEVHRALAGHGLRLDSETEWDSTWEVAPWAELAGCDTSTIARITALIGAPTFTVRAWRARFVPARS